MTPARNPDLHDLAANFVERWCPNATRTEFAGELIKLLNFIANKKDSEFHTTALGIKLASSVAVVEAINVAVQYGGSEEAHHKAWVIDQMVRILAGDEYGRVVAEARAGDDGPLTYGWDEGVAP
jgi:hypothetical protein